MSNFKLLWHGQHADPGLETVLDCSQCRFKNSPGSYLFDRHDQGKLGGFFKIRQEGEKIHVSHEKGHMAFPTATALSFLDRARWNCRCTCSWMQPRSTNDNVCRR